MSFGMTL
ncbi:hypothetical protein VCHENC02_1609A, partial [Vibrio harveyi]